MSIMTQSWIYLIFIALCDTIIPGPLTAIGLMYVMVRKPEWFKMWVAQIYR